nr:integrin alpha-PS2-like isoform X3 [Lepeophtheirus salmonis]
MIYRRNIIVTLQESTFNMNCSKQSILIVFTLFVSSSISFNINVPSKIIYSPLKYCQDEKCMFGFSVAQHKVKNGTSWLLVGAPEADLNIAGIKKSGGVYRCSPEISGSCEIIPFDMGGNSFSPLGEQYDNKSGQWFGSLVRSSGDSDIVLACAPRYVWFSRNYKRREPVGICHIAKKKLEKFFQYSPCSTRKWGYHRQGSCQAGFGADISNDGKYVFIGAVGSWYWQGQIFSQKLDDSHHQHRTKESAPSEDDSYLGYSVTTGDFNGDNEKNDIAVGMPRGANLTGKVILYDVNMTNLNNLTGDQIGAYFGYSVASGDFDGDGNDDIAIGAPMWTNYRVMGKFEVGRIYIVYQNKENRFVKWSSIVGHNHKARFGLSVACAGNLDLDGIQKNNPKGYQDLLVGSPYDGKDNRGALYIYLGSYDGIKLQYSQVIYANDISNSIKTFGWSISGGNDLDDNQYPDVLVGAYDSSQAVYLKSSPVIHLNSDLNFLVKQKQINLEERKCSLRSGKTRVPCIDVEIQLSYHGIGIPNRIRMELYYILDAKKDRSKRMFFLENEGQSEKRQTIQIIKGQIWKKTFTVYLLPSRLHDKLTSLDLNIKYVMDELSNVEGKEEILPVLSLDDRSVTDSISIKKNCGVDNECIPNLSVFASSSDTYTIGSDEKLEISTHIKNLGEDAYNAYLYLSVPKGVNYIRTKTSEDSSISVLCSPPNNDNNRSLKCEIGNPLPSSSQVKLNIMFQPIDEGHTEEESLKFYDFILSVNSSNPEESFNMDNNEKKILIKIKVFANLKLSGTSKPEQVSYNLSGLIPNKYMIEDEIGEEIYHVYDVNNKGPSTVNEADIYIMWPSFTDNSKHSLYLLGIEYDTNRVQCEPIDNINPLYIKTIGSRNYSRVKSSLMNYQSDVFEWWMRKPLTSEIQTNIMIDNLKEGLSMHKVEANINRLNNSDFKYFRISSNSQSSDTNKNKHSSNHLSEHQNKDVVLNNSIEEKKVQIINKSDENNAIDHSFNDWRRLDNGSYIRIFHRLESPINSPNVNSDKNLEPKNLTLNFPQNNIYIYPRNSSYDNETLSYNKGLNNNFDSLKLNDNTQIPIRKSNIDSKQHLLQSIYINNNIDTHKFSNEDHQILFPETGNWEWSEQLNKWKWVGSQNSKLMPNKKLHSIASNTFKDLESNQQYMGKIFLPHDDIMKGMYEYKKKVYHKPSEIIGEFERKKMSKRSVSSEKTIKKQFPNQLKHLNRNKKVIESSNKKMKPTPENGNPYRVRRSLSKEAFVEEIEQCNSRKCTLIQCRVGPLKKGESVVFRIRSRLFTQSHIEDYRKKVSVSSKILARITKLPYQVNMDKDQYFSDSVTTEVFPIQLEAVAVSCVDSLEERDLT